MGLSPHFDFNIRYDRKITAHYQYKKAKKDLEQNKVHTADILQPISSQCSLFVPRENIRKHISFLMFLGSIKWEKLEGKC